MSEQERLPLFSQPKKTAVQQTSRETYEELDLGTQKKAIVVFLDIFGPSCIADIATELNWQRSTVSGRMNELKKLGEVVFVGLRKSKTTGRTSQFWEVAK